MEKNKSNFFITVLESITKFDSFGTHIRQPVGKAVVYLVLLSILTGLFSVMPLINFFNKEIANLTVRFQTDMPEFLITKDKLTTEKNEYYEAILENAVIIVLDTEGKNQEKKLDEYAMGIYAKSDKFYLKVFTMKTENSYSYLGTDIKKQDVIDFIVSMKWQGVLLFFIGLITYIIGKFINVLFFAIILMFFSKMTPQEITYSQSFKLTAYAITLPLILEALAEVLGFNGDFFYIIYNLSIAFYVFMGLMSYTKSNDV